ncbi:MAG: spore germination protein [Bacillota bacterium]
MEENLQYLRRRLGIDICFDILIREFNLGRKKAAFVFIDGFANGDNLILIMRSLMKARHEEIVPHTLDKVIMELLPYGEISPVDDLEESIVELLSGPSLLFIDGEKKALVIDIRQYPARSPEEPDIEKVTRGSQDGFVETLLFNVTLIRRRIRDPRLRTEILRIGSRSLSEVVLLYIEDIVNPSIVKKIKDKLSDIDVDGLPMAEKSVEEFITESMWNPFPLVRYTERPDVAAVHLLEGHVCIIVDTSPAVMIAPVTLFHHIQHAEEFRHNPVIGIYIRWVRVFGIFLSIFLVPIWLLVADNPEILPRALDFIGPKEEPNIPLFIQFIFANFGLDLLRLASIHTPSPLATALGLVGALLIGQIAVDVGFFVPEVLLYIGLVAVGVFSTPSWELSLANRFVHLILLVLTGLFGLIGFLAGLVLLLVRLLFSRSFGVPYLWPLIPLDFSALLSVLLRKPVPLKRFRPAFLHTGDTDTAPSKKE